MVTYSIHKQNNWRHIPNSWWYIQYIQRYIQTGDTFTTPCDIFQQWWQIMVANWEHRDLLTVRWWLPSAVYEHKVYTVCSGHAVIVHHWCSDICICQQLFTITLHTHCDLYTFWSVYFMTLTYDILTDDNTTRCWHAYFCPRVPRWHAGITLTYMLLQWQTITCWHLDIVLTNTPRWYAGVM